MNSKRTLKNQFWLVIKGITMGAANKVPGVSGGVIAFVAGFYEEFIYSLQKVNAKAWKLLFSGRFKSFFHYINGTFLSLLFLGMIISYFSVSKLLDYLLIDYELYVWSAFFGMIIGSIYYITKEFGRWSNSHRLYLVFGVLIGLAISLLEPARENDQLWFVFFCGMISVSGMTLPGLSGSFILMLLGNYVLLLVDSVNALYDLVAHLFFWDFSFMEQPEQLALLKILFVFSIGSLTGLVAFSHLLAAVIKKHKKVTYAVIIGFITGSLGVVWPWKTKVFEYNGLGQMVTDPQGRPVVKDFSRYLPHEWTSETLLAVFFIIFGIAVVYGLERYKFSKKA
ncbi:MAG: hypothetical protein ABR84_04530 [Cryomorphaceae bacterium BACL21 MAG-121220-bin10]|jgi:putative membrane protein|nr:MAG: hypothetical protein ABR84_04530 [Cryomorphaceae bacterium BACL21 MAG-121220-bin10]|tara:strand:+ start:35450 stop:36463 length:1014 start_codon:yes stop_codon:yes gene_type:complete